MYKHTQFRLLKKAIALLKRSWPACQDMLLLNIPAYAKNMQDSL